MVEFLTAEKVNASDILSRLKAIYRDETVDRSTMSNWAIKFRELEAGKANIEYEPRSGQPVSVTDEKHPMKVN